MMVIIQLSLFCWVISGLGLDNKLIRRLYKVDSTLSNLASSDGEFYRYKTQLERLRMPGEDAVSLWISNESSFNQVSLRMEEDYRTPRDCKELIELIGKNHSRRFVEQMVEPLGSVKEYFPCLKEPLWRMTAISLLKIIMEVNIAAGDVELNTRVQIAMKSYKQAVDFMDFVDCPDNIDLLSVDLFGTPNVEAFRVHNAAESATDKIEELYKQWKEKRMATSADDEITVAAARDAINKKFQAAERALKEGSLLGEVPSADAVCADWHDLAESYSNYKVCKIILAQTPSSSVKELAEELLNLLREVIGCCMLELGDVVVKSCREWAAEFREERICIASAIAGKAMGLIDAAKMAKEDSPVAAACVE